jgi:hypothetical protein
MRDRLQQKDSLFVKLGALFGPLQRLIEQPDQYDEQEKAETLAQYFAEYPKLQAEFRTFSTGQPSHNYAIEFRKFFGALRSIENQLFQGAPLEAIVSEQMSIAQAAIDAVPVPRTSVILEAGSPFTAYCRLRELCESDVTTSLVWLDPFCDASIFHRYVASVRPQVPVTLVTSEAGPHTGNRDRTRWAEFLDVSRLYAQERGSVLYRLVVQPNLHDRWVVFDGKRIYALGGSAKDAGNRDYFTITGVEASETNLQSIQAHIDTGMEFFGPGTPHHH